MFNKTRANHAKILTNTRTERRLALRDKAAFDRRIDKVLANPSGFPDGKGKRTKLSPADLAKLKSDLADAYGCAAVFASNGPLRNRKKARGSPPDNAKIIFIDDIVRAIEAVGLKAGLRYSEPVSLPVRIYKELSPLLWPGAASPRRLFERWQRNPIRRE
jgi:hypothetical protein